MTHKKRVGTLEHDDEKTELINAVDKDDENQVRSDQAETGSLSGADRWNFILLVVMCKLTNPDQVGRIHHGQGTMAEDEQIGEEGKGRESAVLALLI